jgi:hypothetical protein
MFKVERGLNEIENVLSLIAAFPGVGTAAGLSKIAMGTTQAVTGAAAGALIGINSLSTHNPASFKHPKTHIKHGGANMVAGAIESIPVVQTVFCLTRYGKHKIQESAPLYIAALDRTKFMAYDSQQLYLFRGSDREKVRQANSLFRATSRTLTTSGERLKVMKEIRDVVLSGKNLDNDAEVPLLAHP